MEKRRIGSRPQTHKLNCETVFSVYGQNTEQVHEKCFQYNITTQALKLLQMKGNYVILHLELEINVGRGNKGIDNLEDCNASKQELV